MTVADRQVLSPYHSIDKSALGGMENKASLYVSPAAGSQDPVQPDQSREEEVHLQTVSTLEIDIRATVDLINMVGHDAWNPRRDLAPEAKAA